MTDPVTSVAAPSERFTVELSLPRERFDTFLHQRYPQVSRGALQRLISQGHIRVDEHCVKAAHHPAKGEVVTIDWPVTQPATPQPECIPLWILYEDESLLVLNKPAGLVVHPAAGHEEHTLVNALLHHCAGELSGIGGVARPGIVHRLDKDTSGCLVVAKTDAAHQGLAAQFAERRVEKVYHAIVCGKVPQRAGDIVASIARHPSHRKRMAVRTSGGRQARTSYRVLEWLQGATLVEAVLHTGRTHQIRVHFQHLGFPLLGDQTYGGRPGRRQPAVGIDSVPRQMLHAHLLQFTHPLTGETVISRAPWPEDFAQTIERLRKPGPKPSSATGAGHRRGA
jgi:23S rRNA pseudouridine1911/1915/1917 synthase